MLSIIVRIPILNSQCIYFVHSKMIRNAHRLLNSMAVHPGPLPPGEGEACKVPLEFSYALVWHRLIGAYVGCYGHEDSAARDPIGHLLKSAAPVSLLFTQQVERVELRRLIGV